MCILLSYIGLNNMFINQSFTVSSISPNLTLCSNLQYNIRTNFQNNFRFMRFACKQNLKVSIEKTVILKTKGMVLTQNFFVLYSLFEVKNISYYLLIIDYKHLYHGLIKRQ